MTNPTHCQNCGARLTGDYCAVCGQRADEPRRAVIGLVQDFFVDTLAIDGKLTRTLKLLLLNPGKLVRRFLDGQRVRYSPPFRLYLFTSVFFFIAAFSFIDLGTGDQDLTPEEQAALAQIDETLRENGIDTSGEETQTAPTSDVQTQEAQSEDAQEDISATESYLETDWEDGNYNGPAWLEPHLKRLYEGGKVATTEPRLFLSEARQNLPRALFLAPVLYAVVLMGLYIYRRKYYVYDHFVVSLYMHSALYAYLLIAILMNQIPFVGWLAIIPLGWGWLQPFLVFKQAYGSGRVSSFLKWLISISVYVAILGLVVMFGLSYSLYRL